MHRSISVARPNGDGLTLSTWAGCRESRRSGPPSRHVVHADVAGAAGASTPAARGTITLDAVQFLPDPLGRAAGAPACAGVLLIRITSGAPGH